MDLYNIFHCTTSNGGIFRILGYGFLPRVQVYQVLEEAGIEIPHHVVLRRDGTNSEEGTNQHEPYAM